MVALTHRTDSSKCFGIVKQSINSEQLQVMQSLPYTESKDLCPEIVQYVTRTRENMVIHDACSRVNLQNNSYILENRVKSVLCMPVIYQNRLKGVGTMTHCTNLHNRRYTFEFIADKTSKKTCSLGYIKMPLDIKILNF